jgi:hypothetical protein
MEKGENKMEEKKVLEIGTIKAYYNEKDEKLMKELFNADMKEEIIKLVKQKVDRSRDLNAGG